MLNNEEKYYTPEKISEMFEVSYRTILDLIHMGKLSAFKIGKQYRISKRELHKYINENKVTIFDYK